MYNFVSVCVGAGVMFDLHTFMPVQQLSGVVHSIHSQADKVATQQTVEVNREEFTLHQAKCVQSYLPHQCKTCRQKHQDQEKGVRNQM